MPSKRKTDKFGHLYGSFNQLSNVKNRYQMDYKRVLFVCSAGLLRSATAAHVFSAEPYNWNTRTAGVATEYALNPVNEGLLHWADEIYLMEWEHLDELERIFDEYLHRYRPKIKVMNVPDSFPYRDPALVEFLKGAIDKAEPVPLVDEDDVEPSDDGLGKLDDNF